jgi:hypothetical protein
MILRLSHALGSKIKAGTLQPMPLDANPYADWSCHLFTADRTKYLADDAPNVPFRCHELGD